MRRRGHCCIVLHTHLPYVHHPEYDDFLEEDWLFEAMCETYLPLSFVLRRMADRGSRSRIAMSWTPPLLHMLRTPGLMEKFERYLRKREKLAALEVRRRSKDDEFREAAEHYLRRFGQIRETWEAIDGDLVGEFARHQEDGRVEVLACSATHGFLPLFIEDAAVRAQVRLGMDLAEQCFGRRPRGFWLPECAWRPGMGKALTDAGVEWVVLDTHGATTARPHPESDNYRPVEIAEGLFAFARDAECSQQVWSSEVGYPGDPEYRELYRDLGYDADYAFIRPFLKSDGVRRNLGLKYHRVTGKVELHEKQPWSPEAARDRAATHAGNFLFNRSEQIKHHADRLGQEVVITAPFDTELFGHWWYEGPWFLEELLRQADEVGDDLPFELVTPSQVLDAGGHRPRVEAPSCTWGRDGSYEVWLNDKNQWFWPYLHEMQTRMVSWASKRDGLDAEGLRLLRQMGRELLLAESSDWQFIITMETSAWYAEKRFRDHVHRFFAIEDALETRDYEEEDLARVERQDAVFPNLDPGVWAPR